MRAAKSFAYRLDQLWQRRTAELRAAVIPRGRGAAPRFTREIRERYINNLLEVATEILVKREADEDFREITERRRLMYIRGRGYVARGERLVDWVSSLEVGPIVYAFWRSGRCLYVGKGRSPRRLYAYERSAYLLQATCLEVYPVCGKSYLGQAECLATHLFDPRDNRAKPARVRWGKECPICREHDFVRDQLEGLFRMR